MSDFDGKVALVAGGYGGIGEACARALAEQGATVVVAGRDAGKAKEAAESMPGHATSIAFDMRDVASMRTTIDEAVRRHGGIDFLVNCAGTQEIQPLTEVTEEAFDRIVDVNLKGAMFLAHGLLKVLVFTLPGTAGFFESVGFPGFLAYVVVPAEVLAGVALLAGFRTRLVAAATIPVLIGAASVHLGNGWLFSSANGGLPSCCARSCATNTSIATASPNRRPCA